jgi:hypothetical protein
MPGIFDSRRSLADIFDVFVGWVEAKRVLSLRVLPKPIVFPRAHQMMGFATKSAFEDALFLLSSSSPNLDTHSPTGRQHTIRSWQTDEFARRPAYFFEISRESSVGFVP